MDIVVGNVFLRASPAKRQALVNSVSAYIHHEPFVNLIRQINVNDSRGNQITQICLQLGQFNSNADLWEDVELWLGS